MAKLKCRAWDYATGTEPIVCGRSARYAEGASAYHPVAALHQWLVDVYTLRCSDEDPSLKISADCATMCCTSVLTFYEGSAAGRLNALGRAGWFREILPRPSHTITVSEIPQSVGRNRLASDERLVVLS